VVVPFLLVVVPLPLLVVVPFLLVVVPLPLLVVVPFLLVVVPFLLVVVPFLLVVVPLPLLVLPFLLEALVHFHRLGLLAYLLEIAHLAFLRHHLVHHHPYKARLPFLHLA
jgi:hypothetical protein